MTYYNKKSTQENTVTEVAKKGVHLIGKLTGRELKEDAKNLQKSIVEDVNESAKDYIFNNLDSVLFKVYKASITALQRIIYGEVRTTRSRAMYDRPSYAHTNYQANQKTTTVRSNSTNITKVNGVPARPKSNFDFDQIIFEQREIAESYLEEMQNYIHDYQILDVSTFYRMVGRPSEGNFTLKEYGWDSLEKAAVERIFTGGYILDLPEPKKI